MTSEQTLAPMRLPAEGPNGQERDRNNDVDLEAQQVPTVEGNGSVGGEGGPQGTDPSLQPAPNGNQSQGGAPNQSEARQAFMAKVLSTVLCQLAFAFLCTIIFHYVEALKAAVKGNPWSLCVSIGLSMVVVIGLSYCRRVPRESPMNVIFLVFFTLVLGLQFGVITAYWDTEAALVVVGVTCGVVFLCACLTAFTRYDLTKLEGFLAIAGFAAIVAIIVVFRDISCKCSNWLIAVAGFVGAVVFLRCLTQNLQRMADTETIRIPGEYVYASITIYLFVFRSMFRILTHFMHHQAAEESMDQPGQESVD